MAQALGAWPNPWAVESGYHLDLTAAQWDALQQGGSLTFTEHPAAIMPGPVEIRVDGRPVGTFPLRDFLPADTSLTVKGPTLEVS